VRAPLIIQTSIVCGIAISIQATLEFLGLGDVLVPTWGVMLNEGFINIYSAPILAVWPGVAISVTIGCFVVLGNALRDALEDSPKAAKIKGIRSRPAKVSVLDDDATRGVATVATEHLLQVTNLGVGYPQPGGRIKTVVTEVSLHLDRGEVLGIVGESGSGKTQTAFSILGLLPDEALITHGSIVFDGHSLVSTDGGRLSQGRMAALRGKRIAYIPQEPMSNLDPNFTIGYQLVRPMVRVLGLSKTDATARALDC
jgi:ABC-type dipeptide/oligopeptide/nickel transport system, ATPase component